MEGSFPSRAKKAFVIRTLHRGTCYRRGGGSSDIRGEGERGWPGCEPGPLCWGKEKGQGFPGGSTTPSPARWLTLQLHPWLENCSEWKHKSSKSWTKRAAYNPLEAQGSSHSSLPLKGSEPSGGGGGMQWCVGALCAEFPDMRRWMH